MAVVAFSWLLLRPHLPFFRGMGLGNLAYFARRSFRLFKIHSRGCITFITTPKMALGGADCIVNYDIKYTSSESTVDMLSRVYFELI